MSYKGTHFFGWQKQKGERPTVQAHLEDCLFKIYQSGDVKTLASGRTDTGVHALGQVVRLMAPGQIPCDALKKALNSLLSPDVRICEVVPSDPSFHPIRDAVWKEYWYLFSLEKREGDPFFHEMVANIGRNQDREKMEQAAKIFQGMHDFCNYCTTGGSSKTTWKRIYESRIGPAEMLFPLIKAPLPLYVFKVRGNGFLKQMVRLMMGAIVEVGRGRVSLEDVGDSLECPREEKIGVVVPPQGLYLREVFYESS